jgi:hypothetical protein
MTENRYATPLAFKQALEARLRAASDGAPDLARRRQLLVFDRCLARIAIALPGGWMLKGGLVLELRLARARTTKDIDIRCVGSSSSVLERLRDAGRIDLLDYMTFLFDPDPQQPTIQNPGMRYAGFRYRTECRIAGKIYGQRFGVDVAFADPTTGAPDIITAEDKLGFAGVPPPSIPLYPVDTHIAEKLHAYTLPRGQGNTRIKDLPDLALLSTVRDIDGDQLRRAITTTFAFRKTHQPPTMLPAPPPEWEAAYERMATNDELPWKTLGAVAEAASGFLDPLLSTMNPLARRVSYALGTWDSELRRWQ